MNINSKANATIAHNTALGRNFDVKNNMKQKPNSRSNTIDAFEKDSKKSFKQKKDRASSSLDELTAS